MISLYPSTDASISSPVQSHQSSKLRGGKRKPDSCRFRLWTLNKLTYYLGELCTRSGPIFSMPFMNYCRYKTAAGLFNIIRHVLLSFLQILVISD